MLLGFLERSAAIGIFRYGRSSEKLPDMGVGIQWPSANRWVWIRMRNVTDMKLQTICHKCGGTGKIELPEGLQETLKIVTAMKRATAVDVQKRSQNGAAFHPTAFNNRLTDLVALGLLTRERAGRVWIYSIAEKTLNRFSREANPHY